MTDFAANIHFRAKPPSDIAGGYGWFLGRYDNWAVFEGEIARQLQGLGYFYVECLELIEFTAEADLNEGEQRELFRELDVRPIQWRTLHIYARDDA